MSLHDRAFASVRYRIDQFGRWFTARVVGMWNTLDNAVFAGVGLSAFKGSIKLSSYLVDGIFSFLLHCVLFFRPAVLLSRGPFGISSVFPFSG